MYSFYGGRPGNSFVIITTFKSIADMIDNFAKGPNYTAVHYDEYVMINTVDKNDPDNGKIYRRGYDFGATDANGNPTGGAEYIGSIVGPAGPAPILEFSTIDDAKINAREIKGKHPERVVKEGTVSYNSLNGLIPGKIGKNEYNDEIKWYYCSLRTSDAKDTAAYVGMQIPYHVFQFETSQVEPYDNNKIQKDTSSINRIDNYDHPFYSQWHINIPKGIKGDTFKNLRVVEASSEIIYPENENELKSDDINHNRQILVYDQYNYDNKQDGEKISYYLGDYNMIQGITLADDGTFIINYTHNNDYTKEKLFKWITSVTLNPDTGEFTVNYNNSSPSYKTNLDWIKDINIKNSGDIIYTHTTIQDESKIGDQRYQVKDSTRIEWPDDLVFDKNNGQMNLHWNYSNIDTWQVLGRIPYIKNLSLDEEGIVTATWISELDPPTAINELTPIRWIESINQQENGTLTVTYNTKIENQSGEMVKDTETLGPIKYITKFQIDRDIIQNDIAHYGNGDITVYYNTKEQDGVTSEQSFFPNALKWIRRLSIDDDNNKAQLIWSDDTEDAPHRTPIKLIRGLSVDTDSNNSNAKRFKIDWYNSNNSEFIGDPINNIIEMAVNNENHLLVRYSDPTITTNVTWDGKNWVDIGSIITNLEYGSNTASNLNWIGIGQLIDNGSGTKNLKFTMSLTQLIKSEYNNISISNGSLTINNENSINIGTVINPNDIIINKQLSGLQFEIPTTISSSGTGVRTIEFANISLENFTLNFSNSNTNTT